MLPQVAKVTGLDVYRDGGSISTSFLGTDGDSYTLFFGRHHMATAEMTTSFSLPQVRRYTPTEYKSPITGVGTPNWKKQEATISWADARALLQACAAHLEGLVTDYAWVFPDMQRAAQVDGAARPKSDSHHAT